MQAAKKSHSKTSVNAEETNVNSETVTNNNINFEKITAANQSGFDAVNEVLKNIGSFGDTYISIANNIVSRAIRSNQTLADITSDYIDELYSTNANNFKESLTCSTFSQMADLTENTFNKQVDYLTRYTNDLLSLASLNFDKIVNEV